MGRTALCSLLWLLLTLIILNVLAAVATRYATPLEFDGRVIAPAASGLPVRSTGFCVRRRRSRMPPTSRRAQPPREGFD
jgi:predicted MFS family arabinose efflux permease